MVIPPDYILEYITLKVNRVIYTITSFGGVFKLPGVMPSKHTSKPLDISPKLAIMKLY